MRSALAAFLTVLLTMVLAACGGPSDDQQVRDTLARFGAATRHKDYQGLCDKLFSRMLVDQIRSAGLPCEVALRPTIGALRRPTLAVRTVEVSGDQALAVVRSGAAGQQPSQDTIKLVREDGGWRIASLAAPQPQPPPSTQP